MNIKWSENLDPIEYQKRISEASTCYALDPNQRDPQRAMEFARCARLLLHELDAKMQSLLQECQNDPSSGVEWKSYHDMAMHLLDLIVIDATSLKQGGLSPVGEQTIRHKMCQAIGTVIALREAIEDTITINNSSVVAVPH